MKEYIFVSTAKVSFATVVKAESLEEAITEAKDRAVLELCNQCSNGNSNIEWTPDELDCDAESMELVDLHMRNKVVDHEMFEHACDLWDKE